MVLEVGHGNSPRRFSRKLHHLKFDETSGHFVPTERRKQNRMMATYSVDKEHYKNLSAC